MAKAFDISNITGKLTKSSDVIEEPKAETPKSEPQAQSIVVKTELDSYIHERLKSQPTKLEDLDVRVKNDSSEYDRVLSLPKSLEKHTNKYTFRWINKQKRALDRAIDVIGWVIVNRALFSGGR